MMESSPTTIGPLLLRNFLSSIFLSADKTLLNLAENHKFVYFLRQLLISSFLFFLSLLHSFFPRSNIPLFDHNNGEFNHSKSGDYILLHSFFPRSNIPLFDHNNGEFNHSKSGDYIPNTVQNNGGDSSISRALSQLLLIISDIPLNSRKYDVVRSLTEKLIDENVREGSEPLLEVNRKTLAVAFSRTLRQLEAAVRGQQCRAGSNGISDVTDGKQSGDYYLLRWVLWAVLYVGDVVWTRFGKSGGELSWSGSSAEKLAAEVLWLAQKMVACGNGEEAVWRWASASNLGWLALSAEPRLQGPLVKVSAFLFKQTKDMRCEEVEEKAKEQQRQGKMKMLLSWLPLLCRASNGTDAPALTINERAELETVLEDIIETLEEEEEREKVLSLWLHHFTSSSSSDWPNLHACYARWCTASRRLLLLQ